MRDEQEDRRRKKEVGRRKKEDEQNRNVHVWVFSNLIKISRTNRVDLALE